ncbi:EAL domain-containing protein [Fusibacter sp. JL298sf-3]
MFKRQIELIRKNPKKYLREHLLLFEDALDSVSTDNLLFLMLSSANYESVYYFDKVKAQLESKHDELSDPLRAYIYFCAEGIMSRSIMQPTNALRSFVNAYDRALLLDDPALIARSLVHLSTSFHLIEDLSLSISYATKAVEMTPYVDNPALKGDIYMNYGFLLHERHELKACLNAYHHAENYYAKLDERDEYLNYCVLLVNIGEAYFQSENSSKAISYIDTALEIANKQGFFPFLQGSIKIISDYYRRSNQLDKANDILNMYLDSHIKMTLNREKPAVVKHTGSLLKELESIHHLASQNTQLAAELESLHVILQRRSDHTTLKEDIIHTIAEGLKSNQFVPYVQAKWDTNTREIIGGEVLARWHYSDADIRTPYAFIDYIEDTPLIGKLTEVLLDATFESLGDLLSNRRQFRISFNLSAYQLVHQNIVGLLEHHCVKYGIKPDQIELEITERTFFENDKKAIEQLHHLWGNGFHLSLDDFGSGYSALSSILSLPLNTVKIDRSLIKDIDSFEKSEKLFIHIVEMLGDLGIETVAEGVETSRQLSIIKKTACRICQGYLEQAPMTTEDFKHYFYQHSQ